MILSEKHHFVFEYEADRLPDGSKVGYLYDGDLLYRVTSPRGDKTIMLYDSNGELAEVISKSEECR